MSRSRRVRVLGTSFLHSVLQISTASLIVLTIVLSTIVFHCTVKFASAATLPVLINDGAEFTNSPRVLLNLDASSVFVNLSRPEMSISNIESSNWTVWEQYNSQKTWDLPPGDGLKSVYVRFRIFPYTGTGAFYNISNVYQASVILDTVSPTLTITDPSQSWIQISRSTLQISWTAEDTGSGLSHFAFVDHNGNYVNVGTTTTYTLTGLNDGSYAISVEAFDNAGNVATRSLNFTVDISQTSSLSISLSEERIGAHESLTISGYLSPPRDNAAISIQYRSGYGAWETLAVVYSEADGNFSYSLSPSDVGSYQVRATWQGDGVTPPCESESRNVEVVAPFGIGELGILAIAAGAVSLSAVGYAVRLSRNPFSRACNASEKLNECLDEKKYEQSLGEIDDLIEQVDRLGYSNRLPSEINKPPYSLKDNLTSIKETLSRELQERTVETSLKTSEIQPYLLGLVCVLNTFRKITSFKPLQRAESPSKFFVPLVAAKAGVFNKVNQMDKPDIRDFWFIWEKEECEPIRIFFASGKIVKARSRWHWQHIDIQEPYVDEKERIEVLILPQFHTPIIRRSKDDVLFLVFAKCYFAVVRHYKLVKNEEVDSKYTESGDKPEHWPPMHYDGW